MKLHYTPRQMLGRCALIGASTGLALSAHAGGFALIEHGASGLGNAYAGAAAVSHDTSTIWFNPAGMSELPDREVAVAFHVLSTGTDWTDRGTSLSPDLGGGEVSGPDTASPGTTAVLPNFYYSAPIGDRFHYGLGIGIPYGSSTEYNDNWKGRYTTVDSGVNLVDINPSLSYRVSEKVRLGAGLSVQFLSAELGSAIDSGAACLATVGTSDQALCANAGLLPGVQANDSTGDVTGDSTAVSFNLGALFLPRPDLKLGLAYRHGANHELDVDGDFEVNDALRALLDGSGSPELAAFLTDTGGTGEIDLPATVMFSAAFDATSDLQLLADLTWTGWSSFEELRIEFDNPAQPDTVSLQEWEDVLRVSVGANYQLNNKLVLRGGLALDEEPIPSPERRTARIPGNDRTWLALGAGYQLNRNVSFDVGYTYLFLDETPIDNPNTETRGGSIVRGEYESGVNIFSAQFNWQFN